MSLYGSEKLRTTDSVANELLEMFVVDDVIRGDKAQIKTFCESEMAKVLQEKNVLKKPTMMRLSKEDDEKRRIKIAAYNLAKAANDPLWVKFKKYSALRRECSNKIVTKYGAKAERQAKIAQKEYIKMASRSSSAAAADKAK